ncbi:MAG: DUF1844 domain-containing protein [Syntrophales bacterium]|jgi:hypothetical protein|nr:DUF1844 domain-containing protein [Syntrophales bacterium]MCK9390327.1 DUF1844 domain-containing protein [Syntrophales bacterium]
MDEEKSEKGFVIRDRRHFDETGEVRRESESTPKEVKPKEVKKDEPTSEQPGDSIAQDLPGEDEAMDGYLPEVNFMNFVMSLSTTAMFHFGDFPDPASGKDAKNIAAAKHTIDTIGMLKAKTEGNLDDNEKTLIDAVLFELRMRYVKENT